MPGAKIAVLSGNPMGNSLYTLRLKFQANYKIPAHSHPKDEHVTILSGALFLGMGDKIDMKVGKALGVGGFAMMPANVNQGLHLHAAGHGAHSLEFEDDVCDRLAMPTRE